MTIQPDSNDIGMFLFITKFIYNCLPQIFVVNLYFYINIVFGELLLNDDENDDAQENALHDLNQNEISVGESSDFMMESKQECLNLMISTLFVIDL